MQQDGKVHYDVGENSLFNTVLEFVALFNTEKHFIPYLTSSLNFMPF